MYSENRKSKDIDNNEREGIIRNDSPMPTRSSFVQNPVDHLEYLAAQEEYAPPQTPRQHDSEPSDHQYQYVGLSSLGQYPIYLSNLEMTEQYNNVSNEYITESNIPQEIETSLPLSPLDEVQTNLKTVTLHQITYAHSPQFQNAIIEVTEDATQQQEHLNPTLPSVTLTRNRSRIKNPKIENIPRIQSGYTAQIQTSYTPLRQEFRESDVISPTHLQQLQLQYRHSDMSTSFLRSSRNSIFQSEIRAAHGDPDDPLLNNKNNPYNIKLSTRSISLPQKLDPHYQLQNKDIEGLTSPVSPGTITVTPLLNGSNANKKSKGLIVCVCFSLIAGIIFTLWAVTTLMPHYTNDQSSGQSINPKQQIPTT